ncbi:SDR family NAD(P)-dependent oxidoreductase [Pleomorphovibrio marinus]|uniref:SDR family NAD(P)-dependent oxidoreductase n=1 Tax=Pleomorphovibrio marinus TaxID=2164132 RepID=UPI000E0CAB58|nr:SDR family oxidoreductase [Pleomorphovibrio marinus]
MRDKKIVIIGGNSGIGETLKDKLEASGAEVSTYSRSQEKTHQLDVTTDFGGIDSLPEKIDGLVYCPGTINLKPFHRFSVEDFRTDFEINVLGAVKTLQASLKSLKKAGSASVVLFSTVAVQTGLGFHSSIASAKGALEGLTRSLAAEWAANGIRVNAVAPSLTDTPLANTLLSSEDKKEGAKKRHPLSRYGNTDDIASAAYYLLSDDSSWVTGQIIKVDGGLSALR